MLTEKYRPATLNAVLGQDKAVKVLKRLHSIDSLDGRAYWISGKSGTGKTTIARIVAGMTAESFNIREMDAGEVTAGLVREWAYDQHMRPMGNLRSRAYIINEAHGLRQDTIRALLVWLEELTPYSVVIFTTTTEAQMQFESAKIDSSPLLSRCMNLPLASKGLAEPFAKQMEAIAVAEGLDGAPKTSYARWFKDNGLNLRAAIQFVEAGNMLTT